MEPMLTLLFWTTTLTKFFLTKGVRLEKQADTFRLFIHNSLFHIVFSRVFKVFGKKARSVRKRVSLIFEPSKVWHPLKMFPFFKFNFLEVVGNLEESPFTSK